MSCQQVETWLVDLARGHVTDERVCAETERHLAACPHCAARFDEEKFVSAALRSVGAHDANVCAPAHVEAGLLAAFRAQAPTQTVATTTSANAPIFKPARVGGLVQSFTARFWPRYALTALAVAVVLVLLAVAALRSPLQPAQSQQTANMQGPVNTAQSAPQPANANVEPQQKVPEPRVVDNGGAAPSDSVAHNDHRSPVRRGRAVQSQRPPETVGTVAVMDVVARANDESVTPFVSLVAGSAPLTSGQLVRVSMPRSALATLGLPVNPARGGDAVKADVLLGEDGLAQAIRFVR